jgi:hypothetical protein
MSEKFFGDVSVVVVLKSVRVDDCLLVLVVTGEKEREGEGLAPDR